jgi:hypothetical protein
MNNYTNIEDRVYYRLIKNKCTPDFNMILDNIPHRNYLDFIKEKNKHEYYLDYELKFK